MNLVGPALPLFEYRLKKQPLKIRHMQFEVECLESLDQTIDALFEHLDRGGNAALLEELCPYFGVVWPSAQALSEFLIDRYGAILNGASILEVGCGLAIPSMVATRFGAKVTAADFHPEVGPFLSRNVGLNGISNLRYLRLDWTGDSLDQTYDFVIGSDILYEKSHPANVAKAIASLLTQAGSAVIADPARPYLQEFSGEMRRFGFSASTEIREAAGKEIFILTFTK